VEEKKCNIVPEAMSGSLSDILPVIVLYKCRCTAAASYSTLIKAGGFREFIVYDNSPHSYRENRSGLPPGAVYVCDENNGGLSKAYNRAAAYAREKGYSRLLLLDQDTVFGKDAARLYAGADRSLSLWVPCMTTVKGNPFSPVYIRGLRYKPAVLPSGRYSLRDYYAVNSGMCVSLEAFFLAGGYNEAVLLDFADFQFLSRLRKISPDFELLPVKALQDFSNDETDRGVLLARFRLYLESARHCEWTLFSERLRHSMDVFLHTLSLSVRTRYSGFFSLWIKKYIFRL